MLFFGLPRDSWYTIFCDPCRNKWFTYFVTLAETLCPRGRETHWLTYFETIVELHGISYFVAVAETHDITYFVTLAETNVITYFVPSWSWNSLYNIF